jgi:hypothetical protein
MISSNEVMSQQWKYKSCSQLNGITKICNLIIQSVFEIHSTILGVCSMHKKMKKKSICTHGSLDALSLGFGHFILEREG